MKKTLAAVILAGAAAVAAFSASAQTQEKEKPDIMEIAEEKANLLERQLDLEVWQVFYVDSTLKHDYAAMQAEIEKLQRAKVTNVSMYEAVSDKWMDKIDSTYRKIFNDEQWQAYMKTGADKLQKARAKRKARAEKAEMKLKMKK